MFELVEFHLQIIYLQTQSSSHGTCRTNGIVSSSAKIAGTSLASSRILPSFSRSSLQQSSKADDSSLQVSRMSAATPHGLWGCVYSPTSLGLGSCDSTGLSSSVIVTAGGPLLHTARFPGLGFRGPLGLSPYVVMVACSTPCLFLKLGGLGLVFRLGLL